MYGIVSYNTVDQTAPDKSIILISGMYGTVPFYLYIKGCYYRIACSGAVWDEVVRDFFMVCFLNIVQ